MFTIDLAAYDVEQTMKGTAEEMPDGPRFFKWVYEAFFFRAVDRSGLLVPLVKVGHDPVRMDASLTLLKWLKNAREELGDGRKGFRLRASGFTTQVHSTELDLLEEIWKAFATEMMGPAEAETLLFMKEQFAAIRATDDSKKKQEGE